MAVAGLCLIRSDIGVFLLLTYISIGLFISFFISSTWPVKLSYEFILNKLEFCYTIEAIFELLKDFPLEHI